MGFWELELGGAGSLGGLGSFFSLPSGLWVGSASARKRARDSACWISWVKVDVAVGGRMGASKRVGGKEWGERRWGFGDIWAAWVHANAR